MPRERVTRLTLTKQSKLRIVRSAATHYPVLVTLSHHVYQAIGAHVGVEMLDRAISSGAFHTLMEITKTCDFESLLTLYTQKQLL